MILWAVDILNSISVLYFDLIVDEESVSSETNSSDIMSQFKRLQEINFLGEWDTANLNNKLFANFESSKGKIRLNFFNELADTVKIICLEFTHLLKRITGIFNYKAT